MTRTARAVGQEGGWRRPNSAQLLLLSAALHLGLLLYANHVDTHPERYGGLKYTDVDWRVISDASNLIWTPREGNVAQGWLARSLGWSIGDPYNRATFRYTPLLPLLISPTLLHPLLGKLLLVLASLAVPALLLRLPTGVAEDRLFWPVHLIWTLNPFVLNITTRGSPEAIICLLAVMLLFSLERATSSTRAISRQRWEDRAAVCLALGASYKIYPVIYVPTIWASLARTHGWLGLAVWRFGLVALSTFVLVNGALWSIWGDPFLEHTYLYHLSRLDHRHNFSPYFFPIYLSLFPSSSPPSSWEKLLDHPLMSFLPQATLAGIAGFSYGQRGQLAMGMFVQTWIFVMFNKVCTSQYFMWGLPLLALLIPHLKMSAKRASVLVGAWVAGQALWLGTAYQLEFMGKSVHLGLWAAGCVLLVINSWVLGEVIASYDPSPPDRGESAFKRD